MLISFGINDVKNSDLPESDKKILLDGNVNPPTVNTLFLLESGLSPDGVEWIIQKVYQSGYDAALMEIEE